MIQVSSKVANTITEQNKVLVFGIVLHFKPMRKTKCYEDLGKAFFGGTAIHEILFPRGALRIAKLNYI